MKITAMTVHLVQWPLKMKRSHGIGSIETKMGGVILRLETDTGLVGWGEAAPWSVFSGTAEANAAALHVYLRPHVVGADPFAVQTIMNACDHAVVAHAEAKAALEMALFDLKGKALGVPVAELLGGTVRATIPLSCSVANPDFTADLDFVAQRLKESVRLFKVKTGFSTHRNDLMRLEKLAAMMPADAELRVDYNQGLEPWDAIRQLRDIEAFKPGFIEQPVPRDQRAALGEITRALDTPILADEAVFTPAEAIGLVRDRFADCVSIKLMKCGGMLPAKSIAAITEAAGMPCYGGTMFEGGIALTAGIHFAASTPNLSLGAEFYTANHVMAVDILTRPLDLSGGVSRLPGGAGLGIDVDAARLASVTQATYS